MATKNEISNLFNLLEQESSVDTFSDRKKLQKLVYLAENFDIDLGFTFTWYMYGPYSSKLTRVMFDKDQGVSSKLNSIPNLKEKISKLKIFLGDDINSSDKLELLSSVHYILCLADDLVSGKTEVLDIMSEQKPQFKREEVEGAYNRIAPLIKN